MAAGDFILSNWGEFSEPALEAAFKEDARPRVAYQLRLIAAVQGVLYVAAISYHWDLFGEGLRFWALALARAGVGILLLAAAALARPPRRLALAQWLYVAGGTLLMVDQVAEYHFFAQATGAFDSSKASLLLTIVLMTYVVAPVPMWMTFASTLLGSVLFLAYQAVVSGPLGIATQRAFIYMLLANGVGYAFRMVWNRLIRRDFALRRELETEVAVRQRAEQHALRADAAKSRFLAVMSHEIRTPLNGVLGAAQLLQETQLQPEQRNLLAVLDRSGNQLATLLDNVLDLARIDAERLDLAEEPFSPAELLASVHAVLYPQARAKGLVLRLQHADGLPPALVGDALRLKQVLINLVGNAVKFTERGEVVLSSAFSPAEPGILRCAFTVRDTGPGLEAGTLARIFAPFEQGDMSIRRRHGGAGLGLAICRELVAAMGGDLSVESVPGQGSAFSFTVALPSCGDEAAADAPTVRPTGSRPLTVLVVDDLEANLIVARGLVESLGHRVRTVTGAGSALNALQEEVFDAVLLDLHMQDLDGLEALRRIRDLPRSLGSELPVFLTTADTEQSSLQACLEAGVQGVLPKPLRKARLAALLSGVSSTRPAPSPSGAPLVDASHVARIVADLGPEAWQKGLRACRTSAGVCLQDLEDPDRVGRALHRLAGLSACYGMPRLHELVRRAEAMVASGAPCPQAELGALMSASLVQLEAAAP